MILQPVPRPRQAKQAPRPGSAPALRARWHTYEHGVVSLWNLRLLVRYPLAGATVKKSDK